MELKVTNDGDSDYSIAHRDGQVYDFAILDKNGKTLYKWSDGMAFTQALTSSTVAAHKIEVYKAELDRKAYRKIKDDGARHGLARRYALQDHDAHADKSRQLHACDAARWHHHRQWPLV